MAVRFCLVAWVSLGSMIMPCQAGATDTPRATALIEDCLEAIEGGDTSLDKFAGELLSQTGIHLVPELRFRGMKCLKAHYGERFFFDDQVGRFISESDERTRIQEEAAKEEYLDELRAAAEEIRNGRRLEYTRRLNDACYSKLDQDAYEALTEPLCAELFINQGFDRN